MPSDVDVVKDSKGLDRAPDNPAAKEGGYEEETIVELVVGPRQVEFVEEPMEIEHGRG